MPQHIHRHLRNLREAEPLHQEENPREDLHDAERMRRDSTKVKLAMIAVVIFSGTLSILSSDECLIWDKNLSFLEGQTLLANQTSLELEQKYQTLARDGCMFDWKRRTPFTPMSEEVLVFCYNDPPYPKDKIPANWRMRDPDIDPKDCETAGPFMNTMHIRCVAKRALEEQMYFEQIQRKREMKAAEKPFFCNRAILKPLRSR